MTDEHQGGAPDSSVPRSRALVAVRGTGPQGGTDRPDAEFLAQLIACERRLPAYRQARKISPDAATNAYAPPAAPSPARLNWLV